jgi:chemotaxis protein CheC
MGDPVELSADDSDSIAEIFNIGMGPPAASLSELVGELVELSVPRVTVGGRRHVLQGLALKDDEPIITIRETFGGPFAGEALLVFSETGGMALVQRLIPGELPPEERDEILRDTLGEVGNIILNGCMASFSNLIKVEMAGVVPRCDIGRIADVLDDSEHRDDVVMFVQLEARLSSGVAALQVVFLLDVVTVDAFRSAVTSALTMLAT